MLSEVYLGKRGRLNPIASIRYISERENRSKHWKIIGLIGILSGILILSYYNSGNSANYLISLLASEDTTISTSVVEI